MSARFARLALIVPWAAVCALAAPPVRAETLVADLATELVSVGTDFAGTQIALFGVIERDAQTVSRSGGYEIITVVRGPTRDVLVQRKARRLGIWINVEGQRLVEVPSYYAVYATAGAAPLLQPGGSAAGLSPDALGRTTARREPFRQALAHKQTEAGLFEMSVGGVDMLTKTFFRTLIRLPAFVEQGSYVVTVHLFADGVRLSTATRTFAVRKVGFEERISDLARDRPLAYGFGVVVLALLTGYVGGVVFRRT